MKVLATLLAVAAVRGLLYAVLSPPFGSPDELAHFEYVAYLARGATGDPGAEAHQPAPYYALMVPAYWLTAGRAPETQLLAIRLASMPFMLGTVTLTWLSARRLAPANAFLPVAATAFVALHPQFAYIGSSANNDNAANLVAALLTYLTVSLLTGKVGRLRLLATVLAIGASLVTKGQILPVTLVTSAVLAGYVIRWAVATRSKEPVLYVGLVVLMGLLLAASREGGALIARAQTMTSVIERWPETLDTAGREGLEPFCYQFFTYWAAFLGETVRPPSPAYIVPAALVLLAPIGYARRLARSVRSGIPLPLRGVLVVLVLSAMIAGVWALTYLTYLRVNSPSYQGVFWSLPTISGRYLFAAIAPTAILVAAGWTLLIPKRFRGRFLDGVVLPSAAFDVLAIAMLVNWHRWP